MLTVIRNTNPETCMVGWNISDRCTYKCWYCPPVLHSNVLPWPDLDLVLRYFEELGKRHRYVYILLGGGEPTLWPKLSEFMSRKPENVRCELMSNGSRSLRWWKENVAMFDRTLISFHPNEVDPDHYVEVCRINREYVPTNAMLILDPPHRDKTIEISKRLRELDISYQFKAIWPNFGQKIMDYEQQDLDLILNDHYFSTAKIPPTVCPWATVTTDVGVINVRELVTRKMNTFKGWTCMAGVKRITLDIDGRIYGGACKVTNLGNLENPIFQDDPVTCAKDWCYCYTDCKTEKWKTEQQGPGAYS